MPQEVNVGLIGYSFMGKAHSHAFKDMSFFFPEAAAYPVMKAICGRNEANVSDAAKTFGWQGYETDWKTLIGRDDIDLIDVSTPGTPIVKSLSLPQKPVNMFFAKSRWRTTSQKLAPWLMRSEKRV